jgi:membrane protease YdiL (CAAX protease family)
VKFGFGGLLFGWLYVRWGFNLWPAFFVHAGLNTL